MVKIKTLRILTMTLVTTTLIVGCSLFESIEAKQIKVCVEDVKSILDDPSSLEVLSTETLQASVYSARRIELKYTAKNAMGGRVRHDAICGFKKENDIALNPDDWSNASRNVFRVLQDAKKVLR